MDAVHLACAEIFGCDFFVTCDDKLIKKANRLNIQLYMNTRHKLFEGFSAKEVYNNAVEFWENKNNVPS